MHPPAGAADSGARPGEAAPWPTTVGPPRPRPYGVKAVLARLPMFDLGLHVPDRLQTLAAKLRADAPKVDVKTVVRAYEAAEAAHSGQQRKSGEPFITHPVGVAEVLAELGMDTPTICAALLHDTVEDTDLTLGDLKRDFGDECAMLVDGVTKLDKLQVSNKAERQAESLRKMLLAMAADFRVLVIKLADRVHNMRTLHHMSRPSQKRIAQETLDIFAPLAHRLGMQNFKWELEDLSFATLHPKRYDEIKAMVAERQPERERYLAQMVSEVEDQLRTEKIRGEVEGRPKHYWSIYEKMVMRSKEFSEIYDLVGLRVIVDSVKDCYAALGTMHAMWRPIPGRFKDYIAMPKFNLYQSLHTTVLGPDGKPLEIQIRTAAMHRTAEFGVAAHWKYKLSSRANGAQGNEVASETQWFRQMLDMQARTKDSTEFLRNLRLDLYAEEVFIFTPKGDIQALPRGSTPVDFAYAIHTDVGHCTIGARVNGRLVSLEYELRNGETVEILTSKAPNAGPSHEWLEFVGSSRARAKIRQWLSREQRVDAIERGRDELERALASRGSGWRRLLGTPELREIAAVMHLSDVDALYRAIGEGNASPAAVVSQLVQRVGEEDDTAEMPVLVGADGLTARPSEAIVVDGVDDARVTLARCCSPMMNDEIRAFATPHGGVSVHRESCPNAEDRSEDPEQRVGVYWDANTPAIFRLTLQVDALDRKELLRDICTVLGELQVNIVSAIVNTQREQIASLRFIFELADLAHLQHMIAQVRRVESVFDAYRVMPRAPSDG